MFHNGFIFCEKQRLIKVFLSTEGAIPIWILEKLKFLLYVLYSCYMKFHFCYIFHIYVISFIIYLLYIYMYISCYLIFLYISFSHYLILNLCDNVFIFIICTKLVCCKILMITKIFVF